MSDRNRDRNDNRDYDRDSDREDRQKDYGDKPPGRTEDTLPDRDAPPQRGR